jgi:hypothetical protein
MAVRLGILMMQPGMIVPQREEILIYLSDIIGAFPQKNVIMSFL